MASMDNVKQKIQPLVSVVTPVYNAEKYLSECIESVLAQTYENWEYVIVDNCSTDKSLDIVRQYSQKDDRIHVHSSNEYLDIMPNWNRAVRRISNESKYCKIVHADDWLFPDCLDRMVSLAEAEPSVGMVASYRLDGNRVNLDGLPFPSKVTSGRKVCRMNLLEGTYLFGSPTSLLIRSDMVRKRKSFYNEDNIHADKEICFELLQDSDFGFVHQILTFTRRHNESNTSRIQQFHTTKISNLLILKKYGRVFLGEKEYNTRMKQVLAKYYRLLSRILLNPGGRKMVAFHKDELNKINIDISTYRLLKTTIKEFLNLTDSYYRFKRNRKMQSTSKSPLPE